MTTIYQKLSWPGPFGPPAIKFEIDLTPIAVVPGEPLRWNYGIMIYDKAENLRGSTGSLVGTETEVKLAVYARAVEVLVQLLADCDVSLKTRPP